MAACVISGYHQKRIGSRESVKRKIMAYGVSGDIKYQNNNKRKVWREKACGVIMKSSEKAASVASAE